MDNPLKGRSMTLKSEQMKKDRNDWKNIAEKAIDRELILTGKFESLYKLVKKYLYFKDRAWMLRGENKPVKQQLAIRERQKAENELRIFLYTKEK